MKIIITENQNYILRRLQQFVEVVEQRIDDYEMSEQNAWWCRNNGPYSFLDTFAEQCIEDFTVRNWDFFRDESDKGGSDMDLSLLNKVVEENYGNYIKNMFVRMCDKSHW
jgi:serine protease inhibitor